MIGCSGGGAGDSGGGDDGTALSSEKEISSFVFEASQNAVLSSDVVGTINGTTISVTVPYSTSRVGLVPTIIHNGAGLGPSSGAAQDFNGPAVMYTVTAEDGSFKVYSVTVSEATDPSAKEITSFVFTQTENSSLDDDVSALINGTDISAMVPHGTDLNGLVPSIIHNGNDISPSSEVANDFSSPVTYTVTAADSSTVEYTVTVTAALNPSKEISSFVFEASQNGELSSDVSAVISDATINVTVPYGTNPGSLAPTVLHSGTSISPLSGTVQDFSSQVLYTVTAEDGSDKDYTVYLNVAAPSNNARLSGINSSIGTVIPAFDPDTDHYFISVENAVSDITITGIPEDSNAIAGADSGELKSLSINDNAIYILVTAENGFTNRVYVVTVMRYQSDYISPLIGTLKYVPHGRFQRDSTPTNVSLLWSGFRMSEYEITRQQFYDIMGVDPSDTNYSSNSIATSEATSITDPVQKVSWYQAITFCNKLSIAEEYTPVYSVAGISDWENLAFSSIPTIGDVTWNAVECDWNADGYRLPTEMEWMWAAMGAPADGTLGGYAGGGTNTTGYSKQFAGDTGANSIEDYVWYKENSGDATHSVGMKNANELGLYDMSGNVSEWCWDHSVVWPSGTLEDYTGGSGYYREVRGGAFRDFTTYQTVSYSGGNAPSGTRYDYGFRVVRR